MRLNLLHPGSGRKRCTEGRPAAAVTLHACAEWSACPGEEPAGLYEKISKDPAFLRLDEGYQESGRVLSRTKLLARAHDTRAQLAEELLELSSPYLEGLLACPSVLQHTQESVTELARDVDRLCQECDSCVRSREELTEKAEFIEFQVRATRSSQLRDWECLRGHWLLVVPLAALCDQSGSAFQEAAGLAQRCLHCACSAILAVSINPHHSVMRDRQHAQCASIVSVPHEVSCSCK